MLPTPPTAIEVVTDAYAASALALKLHDSLQSLYKS
jgi:hypothetical protein